MGHASGILWVKLIAREVKLSIDLGLLILRIVVGLLIAGHGAQKLFGWFGGAGMKGFTNMMAGMGMRPARAWALLAGWGEFGGGLIFALGLLNPLGALGIVGSMLMAIVKVTWAKGLWSQKGGIEISLLYLVASSVIGLVGSGAYSLDAVLGFALPSTLLFFAGLVVVIVITVLGALAAPVQSTKRTTA